MKITLPFFLLILFSFQLTAQSEKSITLVGRVLEKSTETTLPYAKISLLDGNIGTVSNINGEFKIIIPAEYSDASLLISYMGYESTKITAAEVKKNPDVYLDENPVALDDVLLASFSANSLLDRAIQQIPVNYDAFPYKTKGFYRVSSQKEEQYIHLSEAVFELFRESNKVGKGQFKLIKMRAIMDEKGSHGMNLGLRTRTLFELDNINDWQSSPFLSKKGRKEHDFKLEGLTSYNGTKVYVVSFDQKEGLKKAGLKGKVYIDSETYAFILLDYGISPKGIEYYKYGDAGERALMKMLDINIGMTKNNYQISYKKIGDHYFLSDVGNDASLTFRSSRDFYDFKVDTRLDYLVTEVEVDAPEPFSSDEILRGGKLIENQESVYDSLFWDAYTIILPNANFPKIAHEIDSSNKANDLRKGIQERIENFSKGKSKSSRIDSILTYYNQKGQFNGNALIAQGEEIILQKSYNNELTANTKEAQFRIGSASKTFTSMAVMLLENEGKCALSDPIQKYLPAYPHGWITLEQLLTHQSGIPDYLNDGGDISEILTVSHTLDELVEKYCSEPLEFEAGTEFDYSNSGYVILALIVEKISGMPFATFLKTRIFDPLGMENSSCGLPKEVSNLAKGFSFGEIEPSYPLENVIGSGAIISSAEDLLLWSQAMENESLLPKTKIAELHARRVRYPGWDGHYGYGWMIDDHIFKTSKDHTIIYHPGTDFGFYTMFVKQPDEDITIILLNNTGSFPRFDMTGLILEYGGFE